MPQKQNKEILFGVSAADEVGIRGGVHLVFRIWRTYRELNGVSRGRLATAFVIFALLSPVAIALQFGMAANVSGATPPSFPAELVGQ